MNCNTLRRSNTLSPVEGKLMKLEMKLDFVPMLLDTLEVTFLATIAAPPNTIPPTVASTLPTIVGQCWDSLTPAANPPTIIPVSSALVSNLGWICNPLGFVVFVELLESVFSGAKKLGSKSVFI